jgi:serine/threonine protein kinase HipA of HipAB toxin-antitoxin module
MTQKPTPTQRLVSTLRHAGPQSPAQLMDRLGVSQPTLYRAAQAEPDRVFSLGARRNRKLAAAREIPGLGTSIPVFQVNPEGDIDQVGKVLCIQPHSYAFVLDQNPNSPRYYAGLPAFLADARPQGFLGDLFARKHADLGLPPRTKDWTAEDVLVAMAKRGEDLRGNILIGEESFLRYQARQNQQIPVVAEENLKAFYEATAEAALLGDAEGPLVGGIQPKFTALVEDERGNPKPVIVKFSPAGETFDARRWRDLLVCEWIALEVLRDAEIETANGRLVETGGRVFLEVERFDRIGGHGRRRVLSFASLGTLPLGRKESWGAAAAQLLHEGKLLREDFARVEVLECFARFLGNNDRSPDNISFLWTPGSSTATLAPVYDMLPMQFAPSAAGTGGDGVYVAPLRESALLKAWEETKPLAVTYWERVREDERISREMKRIAEQALAAIGS